MKNKEFSAIFILIFIQILFPNGASADDEMSEWNWEEYYGDPNYVIDEETQKLYDELFGNNLIPDSFEQVPEQFYFRVNPANPEEAIIYDTIDERSGLDCTSTYQNSNFETPKVVTLSNGRQLVPTILDYGIARGMYYHNLRITSNIKYLSKYAFENTFTDNLIIEEGLKHIDDYCFNRSTLTTEVIFPNSLYIIGSNVFRDSELLEKIKFGNGLFEIGEYSFSYNPCLKEVILPCNLNRVGKGAFNNCTNLKKVSIPRFMDRCSNAFNGCPNIETIDIYCPFDYKVFSNSFQDVDKEKCVVIVPKGRSAWFRKYSTFRDFTNIIERDDEGDTTVVETLESAPESDAESSLKSAGNDAEEVYSLSGVKYGSADNVPSNEIYIVTNRAGSSQKKVKH